MFNLLEATAQVALLGFVLGILYVVFMTQYRPQHGLRTKQWFLNLPPVRAFTAFSLLIVVLTIPGIALRGAVFILAFCLQIAPSEHAAYNIAGLWILCCIIIGWFAEYYLQRKSRIFPAFGYRI